MIVKYLKIFISIKRNRIKMKPHDTISSRKINQQLTFYHKIAYNFII